jgi:hypothetical protein
MTVNYNFAEASELSIRAVFRLEIFRKTASSKCILQGGQKVGNRRVRNWDCRDNVGENSTLVVISSLLGRLGAVWFCHAEGRLFLSSCLAEPF